jgi:hypothetical protein
MKNVIVSMLIVASALPTLAAPGRVIHHGAQGVPGQYIVVLRDNIPRSAVGGIANSLAVSYRLTVSTVWMDSIKGFLAKGSEQAFQMLASHARVAYLEQNCTTVMANEMSATQGVWYNYQYLWNLDRLDVITDDLRDGHYNMCTEGRSGVAYVIDGGIFAHSEFEDRLIASLDFTDGAVGVPDTTNGCSGYPQETHGTWVASVLAGTNIGAAKPQLVSLRVFKCTREINTADLISAVNWIASPSNTYRDRPGVINHSGFVPIWDSNFTAYGDAIVAVVNSTGIPFFASADNYSTDACRFSPNDRAYTNTNHAGRVFVVGGTSLGANGDVTDYRWQPWTASNEAAIGTGSGSNGGACVSVYAPACDIYLANNSGPSSYESSRLSGTSFASPEAAALAIRWMVKQQASTGRIPTATEVYDFLLQQAQTTVANTYTAPTYWMCVQPIATGWYEYTSRIQITSCSPGYLGPYMFPFAGNDSGAKMLYWNEAPGGVCP